jgi:hypothetical protein
MGGSMRKIKIKRVDRTWSHGIIGARSERKLSKRKSWHGKNNVIYVLRWTITIGSSYIKVILGVRHAC